LKIRGATMSEEVKLHWAEKFRELVKNSPNYESIVSQYLAFCIQEERALKKRFEGGER